MQKPESDEEFKSLTLALEGWFDQPFEALPEALQEWVAEVFRNGVRPWGEYLGAQRRSITLQHDQARDPALKEKRSAFWVFINETGEVRKQIEALEAAPADTADAVLRQAERLAELRDVLARREFQENLPWPPYEPKPASDIADEGPVVWLSYPQAMRKLADAHDASPEELAGWIWDDSLMAYLHANELGASEQFTYEADYVGDMSMDYVAPLSACWFKQEDLEEFEPTCRYITGAALLERWRDLPYFHGAGHIRDLVKAGRLNDVHPIAGATQASFPDELHYPPLTEALFELDAVERVEAEDFGLSRSEDAIQENPYRPLSAEELAEYFYVQGIGEANQEAWRKLTRAAEQNGLAECRVGKGKKGPGGSLWRADLVASWLVARKRGARLTEAQARHALGRIPGYEDRARELFPRQDE